MLESDNSIYYSSDELFSRQSKINFIMGERGNGKSFDAKKRMINNFLKKGEQSVYVRRRKTDIDEMKDKFFDDIFEFYPDVEFKVEGMYGYINGELAIIMVALSTSVKKKSTPFPRVTLIVFDEYIEPRNKFPNYLKDEMFTLWELIRTIVRMRENWRMMIIGNAISYVNPFFTYYNIQIRDNKKRFHPFKKKKDGSKYLITIELTETPDYREKFAETDLAELLEGTSYGDYSMNAVAYEDNNSFILPLRTGIHVPICSLYYQGNKIGVWYNQEGNVYCDDTLDPSLQRNYSILPEEITEGYLGVKSMSKWENREIHNSFIEGNMYFKNQEIKKLMQEIIRYI